MKKCSYCGRENADTATRCIECGTDEFTEAVKAIAPRCPPPSSSSDTLVRDYPKFIVVVGVWMFYLPALLANVSLAFTSFFGELGVVPRVFSFFISGVCGAICAYALYRSTKNYQIHRERLHHEIAGEARAGTAALPPPASD